MKPPFRADQVGSLLRPPYLAQARRDRKLQDKAILEAIRKQEEIGLEGITDGE
jgi:5-methyltetrahydropteroyltriglutamate--homocysteine methyltransferase